jgi:hypothetical protein
MYTGDTDYLNKYYPTLLKVLDTYYPSATDNGTSLLSKGLGNSNGYGDYAFLPRSGPITYYNAIYVLALNQAAELADALSKTSDASRWRARASAVASSLVSRNWDASVGAFFDGGPCPGASSSSICATHSQDGNSMAVLAGVIKSSSSPSSLGESALAYLSKATAQAYGNAFYDNDLLQGGFSKRVYAFISYFELAARFSSPVQATAASAFEELRRLYGWMASHDPGTTFWEGIGPNGSPYEDGFTSMTHGWSTGISPLLTNYVLGVRPTKPGFTQWQVKPVDAGGSAGITWARGQVPTPAGAPIKVSWERDASRGFTMTVSSPRGTSGQVAVPASRDDVVVSVDGKVAYDKNSNVALYSAAFQDGYVIFNMTGGDHIFTIG